MPRRELPFVGAGLMVAMLAAAEACKAPAHQSSTTTGSAATGPGGGASSASATTATTSAGTGGAGGAGGGAPVECNGYEPCGVHPLVVPTGYTVQAGVDVFNQATVTSCASFADCDMWNTHYTSNWQSCSGCSIDNSWNRMGSPFPWPLSRYIFDIPPTRITYVKFHMTAPNEEYVYSDNTPEMHTDQQTQATTCYRRGAGHLVSGAIGNLGGTGNRGHVVWNISVLPGDMGNSGNASTCTGSSTTTTVFVTADPNKAAMLNGQGKPYYCLLREGQDYYLNFMSSGKTTNVDCSVQTCTMGGFVFNNPTTSDGSPLTVQVPCSGG